MNSPVNRRPRELCISSAGRSSGTLEGVSTYLRAASGSWSWWRCAAAGSNAGVWPALLAGAGTTNAPPATWRSALWRLNKGGIDIIEADKHCLSLRRGVAIDVVLVNSWASRLIGGTPTTQDLTMVPETIDGLDLLPGWYDDWISLERESVRQRVLHGLEALVGQLITRERYAEAVTASMMAVSADPLRETAQRTLIQAHLAEGNWCEAYKTYQRYRRLLWDELQIHPSSSLRGLIGHPEAQRMATTSAAIS